MRSLRILAVVATVAVLIGTIVDPQNWFGDEVLLVLVAYLATAVVAFSWWDLWSTHHDR